MLDRLIGKLRRLAAKMEHARPKPWEAPIPHPSSLIASTDRACPVCGAADGVKIDPLLAERGPRPLAFREEKPMLCLRCWSLVLVDQEGKVTAASYAELRLFRATWPMNWRAIDACQRDYQRRQIIAIRQPSGQS